MRQRTLLAIALCSLACSSLAAAGCGYSSGYRFYDGIQSVAVPIFKNETFPLRREVEFDITRAVKQELETRTDLRLLEEAAADSRLEGAVVSYEQGVLTEGKDDVVQETSIRIVVRVRLFRRSDGKLLFKRDISDHETFSTLRGETIETAQDKAVTAIAHRIVADLEPW